jgi:hypothetical protein
MYKICVTGDSIFSGYPGALHRPHSYVGPAEKLMFMKDIELTKLAYPAEGIPQQTERFNALPSALKQSFDYVIIADSFNSGKAISIFHPQYQAHIDNIKSQISSTCKIVITTPTPSIMWNQDWYWAIYNAMIGIGEYTFTNYDIVAFEHSTLMADGDNYLKPEYRGARGSDTLHPNDLGGWVIANSWRKAIFPSA